MVQNREIIPKKKILYIDENVFYAAKGYRIYKSTNYGKTWIFDGKLIDSKYAPLSHFSRLVNRVLRIEPSSMIVLKNGSRLLAGKKGIFVAKKDSKKYRKTFALPRGNKPLNICLDSDGTLYFGEYILNGRFTDKLRSEVHIYKSEDFGETWTICYTFPDNTIRHIHGIFYDKYTDNMWITTGDRDDECIIGFTSDKFKSIQIVKEGAQKYRAVGLLFYKDHIVYGTDTEHEENYIYSFDRETKEEKCLQSLQGSVLMSTQNNEMAAISTAVEPSEVNTHEYAHVWFSKDGYEWEDIYKDKKDKWSARYFQYGRISFPRNALQENSLYINGHALEEIDNSYVIINL